MTHQIVAVIPVRSFRNGKTRLADVLAPERRAALGRHLLAHVVTAARGSGNLGAIAIVSPDPEVLAYAASLGSGIVPVDQDGAAGGLNGALDQGRAWARAGGAGALLILFSDLPRLTAGDVRALTRASSTVAIAPDRTSSAPTPCCSGSIRRQGRTRGLPSSLAPGALPATCARRAAWDCRFARCSRRARHSISIPRTISRLSGLGDGK